MVGNGISSNTSSDVTLLIKWRLGVFMPFSLFPGLRSCIHGRLGDASYGEFDTLELVLSAGGSSSDHEVGLIYPHNIC